MRNVNFFVNLNENSGKFKGNSGENSSIFEKILKINSNKNLREFKANFIENSKENSRIFKSIFKINSKEKTNLKGKK